jgi:hypothetical protein
MAGMSSGAICGAVAKRSVWALMVRGIVEDGVRWIKVVLAFSGG